MAESERIRIFSNGTEFSCWLENNCGDDCALACTDWEDGEPICDLETALMDAYCSDGTISQEIATRLGWTPERRTVLGWPCAEYTTRPRGEPKSAMLEMIAAGAKPLPGFEAPEPRRAEGGNGAR
jgi:hypothetical protein